MCSIIAKESTKTITVLVGNSCCLSVEEVSTFIPKVTRANGWKEHYVESIREDVPRWISWLSGRARRKAMASILPRCRGKRIYYVDVRNRPHTI